MRVGNEKIERVVRDIRKEKGGILILSCFAKDTVTGILRSKFQQQLKRLESFLPEKGSAKIEVRKTVSEMLNN